jgi:hypothetical protein
MQENIVRTSKDSPWGLGWARASLSQATASKSGAENAEKSYNCWFSQCLFQKIRISIFGTVSAPLSQAAAGLCLRECVHEPGRTITTLIESGSDERIKYPNFTPPQLCVIW